MRVLEGERICYIGAHALFGRLQWAGSEILRLGFQHIHLICSDILNIKYKVVNVKQIFALRGHISSMAEFMNEFFLQPICPKHPMYCLLAVAFLLAVEFTGAMLFILSGTPVISVIFFL